LYRAHHALTQPLDVVFDLDEVLTATEEKEPTSPIVGVFQDAAAQAQLNSLLMRTLLTLDERYHTQSATPANGPEFPARSEPSGAFGELDALRMDDRLALQAIRSSEATQIPYREKLAARLLEVLKAFKEDYDGRSLSASAIDSLVGFLDTNRGLRRPSLTATPSGDLYAEWTGPEVLLLGARFLPSNEVQYVIFAPNPLHEGRTDRISGLTTADTLMNKIRHLGWLAE
jgi:hypothetical protein